MVGSKSVKNKQVETKPKKEKKESQRGGALSLQKAPETEQKSTKPSLRKHEKRKKNASQNQILQRDILEKMFGNNERPGQSMSMVRKDLADSVTKTGYRSSKMDSMHKDILHKSHKGVSHENMERISKLLPSGHNLESKSKQSGHLSSRNAAPSSISKRIFVIGQHQQFQQQHQHQQQHQQQQQQQHQDQGRTPSLVQRHTETKGELVVADLQHFAAESDKIVKAIRDYRGSQSMPSCNYTYESSRDNQMKINEMDNHHIRMAEHFACMPGTTPPINYAGLQCPQQPQTNVSFCDGVSSSKADQMYHRAYSTQNFHHPSSARPPRIPYLNNHSNDLAYAGKNSVHKMPGGGNGLYKHSQEICGDYNNSYRPDWNQSSGISKKTNNYHQSNRIPLPNRNSKSWIQPTFDDSHYRNMSRLSGVNLNREKSYTTFPVPSFASMPPQKDGKVFDIMQKRYRETFTNIGQNGYVDEEFLFRAQNEIYFDANMMENKNQVECMKQLLLNVSYNSVNMGHNVDGRFYEKLPIFRKTPLSADDLMGNLQKGRKATSICEYTTHSATNICGTNGRTSHSARYEHFTNEARAVVNKYRLQANCQIFPQPVFSTNNSNTPMMGLRDEAHSMGRREGQMNSVNFRENGGGGVGSGGGMPYGLGYGKENERYEMKEEGGKRVFGEEMNKTGEGGNKEGKVRQILLKKSKSDQRSDGRMGRSENLSPCSAKNSSGSCNSTSNSFGRNRDSDTGFYSAETSPPSSCGIRIQTHPGKSSADRKDSKSNEKYGNNGRAGGGSAGGSGYLGNNTSKNNGAAKGSNHTISSNGSGSAATGSSGNSGKSHSNSFDAAGGDSTSESSIDESAAKKRQKRKRRPLRRQKNEQQALISYINTMIAKYLGDENKEKADRLCFNGGVSNLEGYARRLMREDLGQIVEEKIRIYRRNNRLSFITITNGKPQTYDACITMRVARRYALEGDVVRAFVLHPKETAPLSPRLSNEDFFEEEEEEYDDDDGLFRNEEDPFAVLPDQCPKAFVIRVVNPVKPRYTVGIMRFERQRRMSGLQYYILRPEDTRVPLVYVPQVWCSTFIKNPKIKDGKNYFFAEILETNQNGHCIGKPLKHIGFAGNMEAELQAILANNGLHHVKPFDEHFNKLYANGDSHMNTPEYFKYIDCRDLCVFSIDPENAQDVDDALSLEVKNPEKIVVGVHIADVSRYLNENSELDKIVRQRATSIYLPNQVIHMLPETLCENCSLLPGRERFVMTVRFIFDSKGQQICEPEISRCLIRSCAKLTYEHVQKIIEIGADSRQIHDYDLPHLYGFHRKHIIGRVLLLNSLAQCLRRRRFSNGALSINNPKYFFDFNDGNGEPQIYHPENRQESNFLIEEFMLLANEAIARFIHSHFPSTSILRIHSPPLMRPMQALRERLALHGLHLDLSSAGSIYDCMNQICSTSADSAAMDALLSNWITRPMVRALYICSDGKQIDELKHYALAIDMYTHFTSPIRRYADIMVHRLVAAALQIGPTPRKTAKELHAQADVCNIQKYNAKSASDEALTMMFKRLVKARGTIIMRCVVVEMFKRSLEVLLVDTGHVIKVYYDKQNVLIDTTNLPTYITAYLNNSQFSIKINVFTVLEIEVALNDGKLHGFITVNKPKNLLA